MRKRQKSMVDIGANKDIIMILLYMNKLTFAHEFYLSHINQTSAFFVCLEN